MPITVKEKDMFASIECHDCPGYKRCPKPNCDHCNMERESEIASKNALVALPYYYRDVSKNDNDQSEPHVLRHVEPSGKIHFRVQESIPQYSIENKIQGSTYNVSAYNQSVAQGQVSTATISADNKRNEAARRIAESRTTSSIQTIWVPNIEVPIQGEAIDLSLSTDALDQPLQYKIELSNALVGDESKLSRSQLQFAKRQIKLKGYNPLTHVGLRAENIKMIIDHVNGVLKDIEFDMVRVKDHELNHTVNYSCNPQDIDQVTGLVMALEEHIQQGSFALFPEDKTERATELVNIINQHRIAMESDDNHISSNIHSINAAVQEATDLLWQAVGFTLNPAVRMHQRKMEQENKGDRDFGITYAERITSETLAEYQEVLQGKGIKNKLKKMNLKQRLKNVKEAIKRRLKSLGSGDLSDRYYALENRIAKALDYGDFSE